MGVAKWEVGVGVKGVLGDAAALLQAAVCEHAGVNGGVGVWFVWEGE